MSEQNVIRVAAALQASSVTGVASGQAALLKLMPAVQASTGMLLLDFSGLELMTASAFREAILPLIALLTGDARPCVLVNANEVIREEAAIAAERTGQPLIFAEMAGTLPERPTVVGKLDEKLEIALDIVLKQGEADAKEVSERSLEGTVTTVWNNRLVALQKMGLLRERKVGKTKFYSPVVEGMRRGS
jgi:hypothetical protein